MGGEPEWGKTGGPSCLATSSGVGGLAGVATKEASWPSNCWIATLIPWCAKLWYRHKGAGSRGRAGRFVHVPRNAQSAVFRAFSWTPQVRWWARVDSNARPLPCQGRHCAQASGNGAFPVGSGPHPTSFASGTRLEPAMRQNCTEMKRLTDGRRLLYSTPRPSRSLQPVWTSPDLDLRALRVKITRK